MAQGKLPRASERLRSPKRELFDTPLRGTMLFNLTLTLEGFQGTPEKVEDGKMWWAKVSLIKACFSAHARQAEL